MIGGIGKKVSKKALEKFRDDWFENKKEGVLDYDNKRIILPEEFYTPKGPTNLNWEELAYFHRHTNNAVLYYGGFDGLLDSLCNKLTQKGLMTKGRYPCKGDYYLVNVGGIEISLPDGSDTHGRRAFTSNHYFPRIKEDAEEYVKHFFKDALYPVFIAQIISTP